MKKMHIRKTKARFKKKLKGYSKIPTVTLTKELTRKKKGLAKHFTKIKNLTI